MMLFGRFRGCLTHSLDSEGFNKELDWGKLAAVDVEWIWEHMKRLINYSDWALMGDGGGLTAAEGTKREGSISPIIARRTH